MTNENNNKMINPNGCTFAYLRVSTNEQDLELQKKQIQDSSYFINEYYTDKKSGSNIEREGFKNLLKQLRKNDWLVITSLDRIGRSLPDLVSLLTIFNEKEVRLISLKENFDFFSSTGKLLFGVIGAVSEYELALLRERQQRGIEKAKLAGKYKGRKPVPLPSNFSECYTKFKFSCRENKYTLKMFAQETNLKLSTLQRFIQKAQKNEKKEKED